MISEKERVFLRYWELNREVESSFISKLTRGFPMAVLFGLPILLLLIVVRLFFPDWYMKISGISPAMLITAVIAVVLVVLFYAYFRMQYNWEMNEQLYKELKSKENKTGN